MAGSPRRPRQVAITEVLWKVFSTMAEESGSDMDLLINQAMFDTAVRLGYVNPVPKDMAAPEGGAKIRPASAVPTRPPSAKQKAAKGRLRQAPVRKPVKPASVSSPATTKAKKRPQRPASRPKKEMAEAGLYVVSDDGESEKIEKDVYIIGRSSKCDLVINSVKVSREHAVITRERGEFFIEDLGSANGTWSKGERIEKMKISDGDQIFICDEKFRFVSR